MRLATPKRIQLISEMVEKESRIAILLGPAPPNAVSEFGSRIKLALPELAKLLTVYSAPRPENLEPVFKAMALERNAALSVVATPAFSVQISRIANLAIQFRLPAIGFDADFTRAGLLMS
jgi:hypothetical protein